MTRPRSIVITRHLDAARVAITIDEGGLIWMDIRTDDSFLHGVEVLVTRTDVIHLVEMLTDVIKVVTRDARGVEVCRVLNCVGVAVSCSVVEL